MVIFLNFKKFHIVLMRDKNTNQFHKFKFLLCGRGQKMNTNDKDEGKFRLPDKNLLETYIQFWDRGRKRVGRISEAQRNITGYVPKSFGNSDTVLKVDQAILSTVYWWVQSNMTQNLKKDLFPAVLAEHFVQTSINGSNLRKENPLIDPVYLRAFLNCTVSHTTKDFNLSERYFKVFRKEVLKQYEHIQFIFKWAPSVLIHQSLHNFVLGEDHVRHCPFVNCSFCKQQKRSHILGFHCGR